MANETLLVLSGMGVPPYSARGLTQALEPIAQAASQRRTVNGDLVDLSVPELRKYRSTISCNDQQSPAVDTVWPGQVLTVDCVSELAFETMTGSPAKTVVPGSERTEGDFTFYRPRLVMQVTGFSIRTDEYGAEVGWQLDLEEV